MTSSLYAGQDFAVTEIFAGAGKTDQNQGPTDRPPSGPERSFLTQDCVNCT